MRDCFLVACSRICPICVLVRSLNPSSGKYRQQIAHEIGYANAIEYSIASHMTASRKVSLCVCLHAMESMRCFRFHFAAISCFSTATRWNVERRCTVMLQFFLLSIDAIPSAFPYFVCLLSLRAISITAALQRVWDYGCMRSFTKHVATYTRHLRRARQFERSLSSQRHSTCDAKIMILI